MDTKTLIEEVLLDLGNNKSLTDVSSKIQIIVRLLGDNKLKLWFDCEFVKGYDKEEIPDYRVSQAVDIKADYLVPQGFGMWRISGQSVPIANLGTEMYKEMMTVRFKDTISSIIEYSRHPEDIAMSLNPYEQVLVQRVLGDAQIQSVRKVLSPSTFQTIIDNVQSRIIDLFIDLNETVFNDEIDVRSSSVVKGQIHNVVNNYITAGIVQSGPGVIEAPYSTIGAHIEGEITEQTKNELLSLANRIEEVARDSNEEFDEIAQNIVSIRSELSSLTPKIYIVKNAFRAIAWLASESCKSIIEQLVGEALEKVK